MTPGFLANRRWLPGDPAAFFELDDIVGPVLPVGEFHRETLVDTGDALALFCGGQVVVAIPVGLTCRIGNKFEDFFGGSRDFTLCTDNTLFAHTSTLPLVSGPV